jgi:UDPglucose 6-dehydrogenase
LGSVVARAEELGVGQAVGFLKEVEAINLRRRSRVIELAQEELGDLTGRRVTILGAAFKPETDDIRDSPAMAVAEQFWMAGAKVVVHDPKALDNVRRVYPQLETEDNLHASVRGADIVVLTTEWKQYRTVDPLLLGQHVTNRLIIDGRNALDVQAWQAANWQVTALGRNLDRIPALV